MKKPNTQNSPAWTSDSRRANEPIAIIGLGCRFPGAANSKEAYWELLSSGRDAIAETPAERWNLQKFYAADTTLPGKTQSKWGGYVSHIEQFDPKLFGISPREAASMDPQQRMLLEVAFRAIEDGGHPADQIAGESVSVFVGISSFDYAMAALSYQDRGVINAYSNTGGSSSIAANRVSYCFDLRGPSVAVDTACSSSLVAVHMACESLWRGEANMALAGGVNALIMPDFYVAFSQLGVLSPDGRCKTFDSRANGYVRSEGAGMILLKPLSAALQDGDEVYAVVRGTALNQDGRTPGMTVPSQEAQERLLRRACERAGVSPDQIQYVEAHGTGTPVGDPIEARALGSIYGKSRLVGASKEDRSPCRIGSVKTNIGHLEAGAGIASMIKVALAMHHRQIPAHLHFENPNPDIDFAGLNLQVPQTLTPWESSSNIPRLAGINGFGYGGANAHVILEEAPKAADSAASRARPTLRRINTLHVNELDTTVLAAPVLLPLSAKSKPALAQIAASMADWIEDNSDYHLAELAGYLAHRRSHMEIRATACAGSVKEMVADLRSLAASNPDEFAEDFPASKIAKGPVFVCSGQGPQWWAMGRGLLKYSPAFRTVIRRCDNEFAKYGSWSLLEELTRSEATSRMQKTSIAQPSIFAIQVALAAVWESWGIKPSAIVGHSVGEIAAAYLSGALNFEDACLVAFHRGRTMDLATSHGAMVAAGLSRDEVPQWIEGIEEEVGIAAINGPTSVTISGDKDAIEGLAIRLENEGVFCRRLQVEYAFHSPQMEPVREELLRSLESIEPQIAHTPLISTVTGELANGSEVDGEYWWKNVRQAVRFSDAMKCVADDGYAIAIEIGPHPVLAYAINECFQASGKSVRSVPSLNRQQDDLQCITKSLGSLYALGFDIAWSGFYNRPTRKVPIPSYPFQVQACWNESLESRATRLAQMDHPLLGEPADSVEKKWQNRLDLKLQTYLADHKVRGGCVYPAAAIIESSLAAAQAIHPDNASLLLERVQLHTPCMLAEQRAQWIETTYESDRKQLKFAFRDCEEQDWTHLATVGVSSHQPKDAKRIANKFASQLPEIRERCNVEFDSQKLYDFCTILGLNYGSSFQGNLGGQRIIGEAISCVSLPLLDTEGYRIHPALLDSCFHSMLAADPCFDHTFEGLYLPVEIREFQFYRPVNTTSSGSEELTVHTRLVNKTNKHLICDLDIFDSDGNLCIAIREFKSMRVAGGDLPETTEELIYSYTWQPSPLEAHETYLNVLEPGEPANWLVLMDEGSQRSVGRELVQRLRDRGDRVVEAYLEGSHVAQAAPGFSLVDPEQPSSFDSMLQSTLEQFSGQLQHVVYLWGLDSPSVHELTADSLKESAATTSLAPLHFVQAWDRLSEKPLEAEFSIVTSGAQSMDGAPEHTEVAQGPLVGFGRVVVSEFGALRSKLIDLQANPTSRDINSLVAELLCQDDEDEVLWRDGNRFVHRFEPQAGKPASRYAAENFACQLRVGGSAGIEELHYATRTSPDLQSGEVEIEVLASGLNFSDVMKALDLYPGLPDGPVDLGAECSGRISRVGPDCEWQVGEEVIAVAPGSFATHVVVNQALVARKPASLSHDQAAALPIAFLTADYALNHCARLREGDSVLIHSASGGVGLAAMQLAKLGGIRVFATAGTDEKRQYVADAGAVKVMNSRSLDFANETLEATQGVGVDAVLNSLPGEAITKGIASLKTGGRFLEIGKRDIYSDASLGLFPFRNNLALFAIDLDQLFKQQPARMGQMLRELVGRFEQGELEALPITTYEVDDTVAAYRFMQQGKHIGKVVVNFERRPSEVQVGTYSPISFKSDATYWVAGGLGGFGLQISKWMVEHGAQYLVLSGRSAKPKPEVEAQLEQLRAQGANIKLLPADITKPEDVRSVLTQIDDELPPLKGIIHTAMVLEDKLLVDLDRDTLERVLWPKVLGGWNLHAETLRYELDTFVVFSSLSSVFGHAGQANYSAANALLDSLAYYRRAQGLPGTVMNWGHLGEVGYLAEREQLGQRLERQGVLSFSVEQATDCLEYALQSHSIQLSVLRMDWSLWRGLGITNRVSPRFAHLLKTAGDGAAATETVASAENLRSASLPQRIEMVDRMLRSKAGSLLGIPADQIPVERPLLEMGLDSLMAVEMRNWVEGQMEVNIPISILMRSESLSDVTQVISEHIGDCDSFVAEAEQRVAKAEDRVEPSPAKNSSLADVGEPDQEEISTDSADSAEAAALLEELPDMSQEEISQLLSQMLRDQE